MGPTNTLDTDVLVLGTGGAGLMAALAAREAGARVVVLSKMGPDEANCTVRSWGGFTYLPPGRSDELFRQVVETGGYLNNQHLVDAFVRDVPARTEELQRLGVEMRVLDGADAQGRLGVLKWTQEGPNSGFCMTRPLRAHAEEMGVRFLDRSLATRILVHEGRCAGVVAVHLPDGSVTAIAAKAVVIATGGGARLYGKTDNPPGTTGDGIALAYQAGAELVDMECVSFFYPADRFARLREAGSAADADLRSAGFAHYFLGGIRIDDRCRSTLPGLFAAGEAAGGLFGAARLGGSAMADLIVFGPLAGRKAAAYSAGRENAETDRDALAEERRRVEAVLAGDGVPAGECISRLAGTMWRHCGTVKDAASLALALEELDQLGAEMAGVRAQGSDGLQQALEAQMMLPLARLIAAASLRREESRGCFWRADFPEPDNSRWVANIRQRRVEGEDRLEVHPAEMTRLRTPGQPRVGQGCFPYLPEAPSIGAP